MNHCQVVPTSRGQDQAPAVRPLRRGRRRRCASQEVAVGQPLRQHTTSKQFTPPARRPYSPPKEHRDRPAAGPPTHHRSATGHAGQRSARAAPSLGLWRRSGTCPARAGPAGQHPTGPTGPTGGGPGGSSSRGWLRAPCRRARRPGCSPSPLEACLPRRWVGGGWRGGWRKREAARGGEGAKM